MKKYVRLLILFSVAAGFVGNVFAADDWPFGDPGAGLGFYYELDKQAEVEERAEALGPEASGGVSCGVSNLAVGWGKKRGWGAGVLDLPESALPEQAKKVTYIDDDDSEVCEAAVIAGVSASKVTPSVPKKPYACKYADCNYATSRQAELIAHERTHTGERPYACSECDYRARTGTTLNKHQRRKHPEADSAGPGSGHETVV